MGGAVGMSAKAVDAQQTGDEPKLLLTIISQGKQRDLIFETQIGRQRRDFCLLFGRDDFEIFRGPLRVVHETSLGPEKVWQKLMRVVHGKGFGAVIAAARSMQNFCKRERGLKTFFSALFHTGKRKDEFKKKT